MWVGSTDRGFKSDQADQWLARVELIDVAFLRPLVPICPTTVIVSGGMLDKRPEKTREILTAWKKE